MNHHDTTRHTTYSQLLRLDQPITQLEEAAISQTVCQQELAVHVICRAQTAGVAGEAVGVGQDLHSADVEHLYDRGGNLMGTLGEVVDAEGDDEVVLRVRRTALKELKHLLMRGSRVSTLPVEASR